MSVLKVVLWHYPEEQDHANPLMKKMKKTKKLEAISLKFSDVINMFSPQF